MSMLLSFWRNVRQATAPRPTLAKRRLTTLFRPRLEALEDRLAPATLTWTGQVSELWSDARNWSEGTTPYATPEADDLIFPRSAAPRVSNHDGPGTAILTITFNDSGYILRGGDLVLPGGAKISSEAPGGTNTIENRTLTLEAAPFHGVVDMLANANNNLRVSSTITGGGAAIFAGTNSLPGGTLTLLGNNSYTAETNVAIGVTLVVGSNTAVGTGVLALTGGTLESSTSVTLANPIDVRASPRIGGNNGLRFTGSVQILVGGTLTVANTAGVVSFDGVIFGSGSLAKTGNGQLTLRGVNTYEGGTEIQGGVVLVETNSALGRGTLKLSGGTLGRGAPSAVTVANPFEVSVGAIGNVGLFPFTFTGPGKLLAGGTLTVVNTVFEGQLPTPSEVLFTGVLSGPGSLIKAGGGITTLSGSAANTYTGTTTVTNGKLVLSKPPGVNAIAGKLVIGDGVGGASADIVELAANEQIANTVAITVNASGLLRLNGKTERYGSLTGPGKVTLSTMLVGDNNESTTFEGDISGPGSVTKVGTGTWTLSGANTYTLGTFVEEGTLLVDGSIGAVTVSAGATLGGTGTTGPVTLSPGAALDPGGPAPGIQSIQDLAFSPGSSYVVQLDGPDPGTGYDQLDVTGTVSLDDPTLDASLGFSPDPGQRFVIIENDGTDPVSGTFAGLPQAASLWIGGVPFHVYYDGGDGNDVELVRNVPPAVTAPGDQTAFQNVDQAIGGIRVGDPEDDTLTMTLQVGHGTLTLPTVAGLTVSGNGTSSVSLSGGIADLNAALASLLYRGDHNYSGADALTVAASDGLEVTSASVAIRVKSLAEQAADLQAQVSALRAAGVLNSWQATSLTNGLRLQGTAGDVGRVQVFLNLVAYYLDAGVLTQAQADALSAAGNVLLRGVSRR